MTVFGSFGGYTGKIGSRAAADAACAPSLVGVTTCSEQAWAVLGFAADHIPNYATGSPFNASAVVRDPSGSKISPTWAQFVLKPKGNALSARYWWGINTDGTVDATQNCFDWSWQQPDTTKGLAVLSGSPSAVVCAQTNFLVCACA